MHSTYKARKRWTIIAIEFYEAKGINPLNQDIIDEEIIELAVNSLKSRLRREYHDALTPEKKLLFYI